MTTIVSVRRGNSVVIGGDGQVSLGNTVMKGNARKVRRLYHGKVIAGFAPAVPPTPLPCLSDLKRSWKNTRAIWFVPLWSWPRTGAPTAPCVAWRPCWP